MLPLSPQAMESIRFYQNLQSLNQGSRMNDITRIMNAIENGEPQAAERLLPLIYDELRGAGGAKLRRNRGIRCKAPRWFTKHTCDWSVRRMAPASIRTAPIFSRLPRPPCGAF